MVTVKCVHCQVVYRDQPTEDYATHQHNWTADHAPEWKHVS